VRGVYAATFFDLGDNGMLDVLLAARRPENASEHRIVALENEQSVDAFFLTTLGLNGVCQAWCPSGARFPSPKPYGVNQPGVTTKFTVTLMSGRKRLRQGAQLTQSAYLPLQAPYQFFGLGRTNNYIEEFSMGMPRTAGRHHQRWVAIIPNSQLIMFPYEPWKPENWSLELFVSPSSSLVLVVGVLAAVLTLLALLIAFFHWKERKQDESESQSSRLLTF
jgi:integrin alpha FG-GAP repeat containing protein 1